MGCLSGSLGCRTHSTIGRYLAIFFKFKKQNYFLLSYKKSFDDKFPYISLYQLREMLEHLLIFSWNGIDVIFWHSCNFLIKKITFMSFQENTRRCSSISHQLNTLSLFLFFYFLTFCHFYHYIIHWIVTVISNTLGSTVATQGFRENIEN
jgi:hypothetical protein